MSDFTNFRAVYDELTDEVTRARYPFLPDHLRNWFDHLDSTPQVAPIVSRLQHGLDIDGWAQQATVNNNRSLNFGSDREKALGMKLLLFRAFADKKQDIAGFGFQFLHVGRNVNDNARAFVEQVFNPMARELRRLLEGELLRPEGEKAPPLVPVPASDRSVTIDHNSRAYADAEEAMEKLEIAIREANDFSDPLEKEQREAEVSAARRLLRATLVRLEPLAALLRPILVEYGTKVKTGLIAHAAAATVGALIALLGVLAPLLKSMLGL
jgi:hypothetical protein